jgi:hypothetical protein
MDIKIKRLKNKRIFHQQRYLLQARSSYQIQCEFKGKAKSDKVSLHHIIKRRKNKNDSFGECAVGYLKNCIIGGFLKDVQITTYFRIVT